MSWSAATKAWQKMFKGTRYQVYCTELNAPPTKEGSYQAANDWWSRKVAQLKPTLPNDYRLAIENLKQLEQAHHLADGLPLPFTPSDLIEELELQGLKANPKPLPDVLKHANPWEAMSPRKEELIAGEKVRTIQRAEVRVAEARAQVEDRLRILGKLGQVKTPKDKTIGANLDRFLDIESRRMRPQTFREFTQYFDRLDHLLTRDASVEIINEQLVDDHYLWLADQPWEGQTKNKRLGFFRRFLLWLDEQGVHPRPKNLKAKGHRFKLKRKKIDTFEGVAKAISSLPDEPRLWAMLAVNTGMTQADLGALNWDMINLKAGTLTRYRVKTQAHKNAPTVCYKLWPTTLKFLKARATKKGLVFSTEKSDKPLYETRFEEKDGKKVAIKKDLFSTYWKRIEPHPSIPLGKFRHIGATTLKTNNLYRGFRDLYLANVPEGIGDTHYSAENDQAFWECLEYIRKTLGL